MYLTMLGNIFFVLCWYRKPSCRNSRWSRDKYGRPFVYVMLFHTICSQKIFHWIFWVRKPLPMVFIEGITNILNSYKINRNGLEYILLKILIIKSISLVNFINYIAQYEISKRGKTELINGCLIWNGSYMIKWHLVEWT